MPMGRFSRTVTEVLIRIKDFRSYLVTLSCSVPSAFSLHIRSVAQVFNILSHFHILAIELIMVTVRFWRVLRTGKESNQLTILDFRFLLFRPLFLLHRLALVLCWCMWLWCLVKLLLRWWWVRLLSPITRLNLNSNRFPQGLTLILIVDDVSRVWNGSFWLRTLPLTLNTWARFSITKNLTYLDCMWSGL